MATGVIIGSEATRPDIEAAIRDLWGRRSRCELPVTRFELEAAVDELLDRLCTLDAADQ